MSMASFLSPYIEEDPAIEVMSSYLEKQQDYGNNIPATLVA